MTDLPIEDLLPRANNSIYKLVSMASARALELSEGRKCLIENPSSEKFTTMALEEIAQGKIECKELAEQRKPNDKPKGE
jgi:DNA-directed RNA polymerase omega subunit